MLGAISRSVAMFSFVLIAAFIMGFAFREMEAYNRLNAFILFMSSGFLAGAGFLIGLRTPRS